MLSSSVKHRQDTVAFLTAIGLIIITILSIWLLKKLKLRFIHETGAALLYGMFLGVIVKSLSPGSEGDENWEVHKCVGLNRTHPTLVINISNHLHSFRHVGMVKTQGYTLPKGTFDPEVLFNLFLPPIIFHGAYTLNQRRFIDNLGSVLTFALLGTVLTCGIIGACVYAFSRLMVLAGQAADDDFLLTDCLLFGALMSATDPVSVLGMLSELHVDPDLYTLLFGESVLNDGVAIVLTHAIATYSLMGGGRLFDTRAFFLSAGHFVAVFAGSFLLGLLFTVITALLTKFAPLHENPLLETSLLFLLSWSSFLSAEACGLSGIVAVLFCGLGQARYTLCNLSSEGKTRIKQLLEFSKFLGEIFIFSYMGYILLAFQHHVFKPLFICGAFLSICISRACNIYPLSFLLNLCRTTKIPQNFQHFMMFAGLRGAVAFALALRANDTPTEVRRSILSTTLLVVCVTVLLLGTATMPMLSWLDIRVGVDGDDNPEDQSFDQVTTERPGTQERPPDTATQGLWHCLDHRYLMPALTHSGPPLTFALPSWCGPVARIFRSSHAYEDQKQLQEPEVEVTCVKPEDAEAQQGYVDGNTGSEHPENLLEGDLGLGSDPALAGEA